VDENLYSKFNSLYLCLIFKQCQEGGGKQGKMGAAKKFPAELSTKRVDSFPLAPGVLPLQPRAGIDVSEMKV
jgi:hypothetical protein